MVDGILLPRSYTIVFDWGMLVSIVLWPSELGDIGVNMIISVGVVRVSCMAREPWSSLLECIEGSRVMGLIISTYILI